MKSQVISFNHQYWKVENLGACFKAEDLIVGTTVMGLSVQNHSCPGQRSPAVTVWVGITN
jgi:hypothetical protein